MKPHHKRRNRCKLCNIRKAKRDDLCKKCADRKFKQSFAMSYEEKRFLEREYGE